ncbi:MAG TPA: cation:proton antiporter [Gemmatimonadota bacterium]|nr:cation:proton antiporter [Gemmatimonadota bacterium]
MHGVALLLAAAAAGHVAARVGRLPPIPFLLLAGVALSILHRPSTGTLQEALVLGTALLVFVAGLELDLRRVRARWRAALLVGTVQFTALGGLGLAAASALGLRAVEAGYVALALAASSTLVGVRLLQRRQQLFEPFGRLVVGVLLLQDALVLLLVPFVSLIGGSWADTLPRLGAVAILAGSSLAVRRWLAPLFLGAAGEGEVQLVGALAVLFAFMGAAVGLGLPLVVGAFLAGASLSTFPVSAYVRAELTPVGDFFAAVFFVALGSVVGVPGPAQLLQAGVLTLLVVTATPLLVTLVAERAGLSARSSIEAGLLLAQTSEISLVVGLSGLAAGHLSGSTFTVLALVTGGTMLLTPFLSDEAVAWRLTHLHPARWLRRPRGGPPVGHVLLAGCGSTGRRVLDVLVTQGRPILVMDEDPAVLRALDAAGVATVRGDVSDSGALDRAGIERADAVVSTVHRPRDNAALLRRVAGRSRTLVRVFDEEDARWVETLGGVAVLASEVTAEAFLAWYDGEKAGLEARREARIEGARSPGVPGGLSAAATPRPLPPS